MRALIQRVSSAEVEVEGKIVSKISKGLLILLGVKPEDSEADISKLAKKCAELRIFEDANGKMNLSVMDVEGKIIVVSQFTLYASCDKGRRPSFDGAARPDFANIMYEKFCEELSTFGIDVGRGVFGAHMDVSLTNDGPVTIMLDSAEL